ncbi:hypothetical protein BCU94_18835 [Shewanella sp. 10N.286.52.C2]|uniref:hypothetical protein n=1 Tax=Shewanella sp. 10N.286.52.C2 TaxID=1880838 RepID=UPI000C824431|nr:hypothetical protein [Shewanella sp. 10N.286.52.C2]PMG27812.1 hypothetical protein BCU94_18835 [Shewanella sp. 10N.286.52.C2]
MIIQNNSEQIESFKLYLDAKLANIDSLNSDDDRLFKKILYVSFLDSLAACVFPNRGNKDRFTAVIERFSEWENKNDFCLLHLAKFCSINPDPALEKVRIFSHSEVDKLLTKADHSGCIKLNSLPSFDEVKKHWIQPTKDSQVEYKLDDFKLVFLLYKLRNSLVHQFQSKGTELGMFIPDSPYYQVVNSYSDDSKFVPISVELVYPTSFIKELCHKVFSNVIVYLHKGNINPFPHYHAGDYWLEGLNR